MQNRLKLFPDGCVNCSSRISSRLLAASSLRCRSIRRDSMNLGRLFDISALFVVVVRVLILGVLRVFGRLASRANGRGNEDL